MTCTTMRTLENYIGDVADPNLHWTVRRKRAAIMLVRTGQVAVAEFESICGVSKEELCAWEKNPHATKRVLNVYQYGGV